MTDLNEIKAGKYELTAVLWDQVTSKPGQPFDFTRHRRGDEVDLSVQEARRLVLAGAVKVPGDEPEPPGQSESIAPGADSTSATPEPTKPPTKPPTVEDVLAAVGDDKAKAQAALDEENARGEAARSTLVSKLTAIVDASA